MYGKVVSKPQRKLGHFNVVDMNDLKNMSELLGIVDEVKNIVSIVSLD